MLLTIACGGKVRKGGKEEDEFSVNLEHENRRFLRSDTKDIQSSTQSPACCGTVYDWKTVGDSTLCAVGLLCTHHLRECMQKHKGR